MAQSAVLRAPTAAEVSACVLPWLSPSSDECFDVDLLARAVARAQAHHHREGHRAVDTESGGFLVELAVARRVHGGDGVRDVPVENGIVGVDERAFEDAFLECVNRRPHVLIALTPRHKTQSIADLSFPDARAVV